MGTDVPLRVQARTQTYAEDLAGTRRPAAQTELARIVAHQKGWTIGGLCGCIVYDEKYRPLAGSIEELAELLLRAGVFAPDDGIAWGRTADGAGGASGLGSTDRGTLSPYLHFLREHPDEA